MGIHCPTCASAHAQFDINAASLDFMPADVWQWACPGQNAQLLRLNSPCLRLAAQRHLRVVDARAQCAQASVMQYSCVLVGAQYVWTRRHKRDPGPGHNPAGSHTAAPARARPAPAPCAARRLFRCRRWSQIRRRWERSPLGAWRVCYGPEDGGAADGGRSFVRQTGHAARIRCAGAPST